MMIDVIDVIDAALIDVMMGDDPGFGV